MRKRLYIIILLVFPILVFAQQPPGNGMKFDGNSDYYTVPDNSSIDLNGSLTIEVWINPCDTVSNVILSKHFCAAANGSYFLQILNGRLRWAWLPNGNCNVPNVNSYVSTSAIIRNNTWQHIAIVHTPTSVSFYYNGNLVSGGLTTGSYSGVFKNNTQPLRIGVYMNALSVFGLYYNGRMDEIRLWNTALTSSQISSRYTSQLIGNEPNLQLYHNFESISGFTINNSALSTGATNNGTKIRGLVSTRVNSIDYPNPFSFGNDTILCDSVSFSLTIPLLYSDYLWNDGTTNNIKPIVNSGTYIGSAYRDFCFTSDTISILYVNCDSVIDTISPPIIDSCFERFIMPNVFTPNNDGINDLFKPVDYECLSLLEFKIYNRWGQLVYNSTNKIEWDGKAKNGEKVSEGNYYWIIQHKNKKGVETYEKGFVSVFI